MNLSVLVRFEYRKNLDKRRKVLRERSQVLTEVLNTEEEYVSTLTFLMVECKDILVQRLGLAAEYYTEIFGCIEGIYMLHCELLKELQTRFKARSDPAFWLGDILCKYLPFFKVYSSYIRNLDNRRNELIELKAQGKLKTFRSILKENEPAYSKKYSAKTLQYLSNIQLADYINVPNQRLFKYDLMLSRYAKSLGAGNPDYKPIREALAKYRQILNKINEEYGENELKKCMELDKKFGDVIQPHRKFKKQFSATYWAGGNRVLSCLIYILNDLILIVDEQSGKIVRRLKMDAQSWFHRLEVGKNIITAVFLKGTEGNYQTVFLSNYYVDEFLAVIKKLFSELPNRLSLKNDKPMLIIRPVSASRQGKNCVFTLHIKIHGAKGGVYNSYTIPQLQAVMEHLIKRHGKLFRTLEEVSEMSLNTVADGEGINDFDAEHIALNLFQYFAPLLCNFELVRSDPNFQYLFGIRDYIEAHFGAVKYDQQVDPLSQSTLQLQGRVRIQQLQHPEKVQVNIFTESGYKRKLIIGKEQRNYSIIRRILSQQFCLDFGIFISSNQSRMRLLDDDDILYRVMKREGYAFKEETSFFMKAIKQLDGLLGSKQVTIHLRKYLYLESPYQELLDSVGSERLAFLTDNILSIMYSQQRIKLSIEKVADMLALVMRLKENGITAQQQQQLVSEYWEGKVKASNQPEGAFRDRVFAEYDKVKDLSEVQCFTRLFRSVQFWSLYSYAVDCRLMDSGGRPAVLIIKHRVLEIRQRIDSESPLMRFDLSDLDYSVTPSYIKLNIDRAQFRVQVQWVYGVVHVIQRNLHIQRLKNPQLTQRPNSLSLPS